MLGSKHLKRISIWLMTLLMVGLASTLAAQQSADRALDEAVDLYSKRDYAGAAARLEAASQQFSDRKEIYYWLGMAYREQGKFSEAAKAFTRQSELDPMNGDAFAQVAKTYMRARNFAQAVNWYEKAIRVAGSQSADLNADLQEAKKKLEDEAANPVPAVTTPAPPPSTAPAPASSVSEPSTVATTPAATDTNAAKTVAPLTTAEFLQHGFVGRFSPENRAWGHALAVVFFALVPPMVYGWRVATCRFPLLDEQLGGIFLVTLFAYVACYFVAWGYEPHWRMILCGLYATSVSLRFLASAKQLSDTYIRTGKLPTGSVFFGARQY